MLSANLQYFAVLICYSSYMRESFGVVESRLYREPEVKRDSRTVTRSGEETCNLEKLVVRKGQVYPRYTVIVRVTYLDSSQGVSPKEKSGSYFCRNAFRMIAFQAILRQQFDLNSEIGMPNYPVLIL